MATKEQILDTALKYFAEKGYENTSLEEIAKDTGITKPAVYYYFKNKKALYNDIFKKFFKNINFFKQESLEKNIDHYIDTLSSIFLKNPEFAKLFAKELACEGKHLEEETLKITSKTIKFLKETLKDTKLNPFFIQTLVIASFTTYLNTVNLRKKVGIILNENIKSHFNIKEEITKTIKLYIKAHL
jgi:AcrR family transcriptional regulator